MIYNEFKKVAGEKLECRYYPGSGFAPHPQSNLHSNTCVLPGDPDPLPPTKKPNIATLLNTSGHRAGVNQVRGFLTAQSPPNGRYSFWIGNDMYLYIIARDLCKTTYTHIPCMQAFKGVERLKSHMTQCTAKMEFQLDNLYKIPQLENCIYTFGWALLIDGLWHLEYNASMRIHQRLLKPIFGNSFAKLFGRKSPKAIDNFFKATDHHKGNYDLEVCYLGGKFLLLRAYMQHNQPPFSSKNYFSWIANCVHNQYILFLNQLVMGVLESYFQLKEGVKTGDDDMLMGGLLEVEKIFFFKKTNRNYQQSAAYRAGDLIKMPDDMIRRRTAYQATAATAYNSVQIKGEENADLPAQMDTDKEALSKFEQKNPSIVRQGNDACLEQMIKRSKKGARISNMDARGWNTEFRTMRSNIGLRKKLERDLGKQFSSHGGHVRQNLPEIIMFEALITKAGWLDRPGDLRDSFLNLDGDNELSRDLVDFWRQCGLNRDTGVEQLLRNQTVKFKDVCALSVEEDQIVKDMKAMLKDLPKMISEISQENLAKTILEEHFEQEIRKCTNVAKIANFHENIQQILLDQTENGYESDMNEDDEDTL